MCKASKNDALQKIAYELESSRKFLIEENEKDLEKLPRKTNSPRQWLIVPPHPWVIDECSGIRQLIDLPDPVGQLIEGKIRPNGRKINKVRTDCNRYYLQNPAPMWRLIVQGYV